VAWNSKEEPRRVEQVANTDVGPRAGAPLHVLIVDDNPDDQALIVARLRRIGAVTTVAGDGEEAIALLGSMRFDLVVLDIMLPRRNGLEVAAAVRALPNPPRLIVHSAIGRHFTGQFGHDVVVLQKPFDLEQLDALIDQVDRPSAPEAAETGGEDET